MADFGHEAHSVSRGSGREVVIQDPKSGHAALPQRQQRVVVSGPLPSEVLNAPAWRDGGDVDPLLTQLQAHCWPRCEAGMRSRNHVASRDMLDVQCGAVVAPLSNDME